MNHTFIKLLLLITTILIFPGCSQSNSAQVVIDPGKQGQPSNPNIVNSRPGAGDIFVIGDSLAYGTGASDLANSPSGCLAIEFSPSSVSNLATPGFTSKQVLNQVQFFLNPPPKLVFLSTGGNDALADYSNPGSYPSLNSLTELKSVIEQFQKVGALVAYLKINPPFDPTSSQRLVEMAQAADQMGAIIIDGMEGLWNTDKMSDQFHPNDEGYKIMCEKMKTAISPYYP